MGEKHTQSEKASGGNRLPVKEHYQAIVETINTLLDLGVIQLPDISAQWKGYINAALKGDSFLLTQAMERWEKTIDPLLAINSQEGVIRKWKQSELEYLLRVHKILTFYNLITTLANGE